MKKHHKRDRKKHLHTLVIPMPTCCAKVVALCMEQVMNKEGFEPRDQKAHHASNYLRLENFTREEIDTFIKAMLFNADCQHILTSRWDKDIARNGVTDHRQVFRHRLLGSLCVLEDINTGLFDITNLINEWNRRNGDNIEVEPFILTSISKLSDHFVCKDGNWWSDRQGMVAVATELDPAMHITASEVFKVCGDETEELKALHAKCAEVDESEYYLKNIRKYRKENGTDNQ